MIAQQMQQPPQGAQPPQPPQGQSQAQPGTPKLDPVTERIVTAALKAIYSSPQMAQGLVRMVAATSDPAAGLAHATMVVLGQLMRQVKGIDPKTVYRAAPFVCAAIAELAVAAKVMPQDPKIYEKALQMMLAQIQGAKQPQQQPPEPEGPDEAGDSAQEEAAEQAAPPAQGMIGQQMGA